MDKIKIIVSVDGGSTISEIELDGLQSFSMNASVVSFGRTAKATLVPPDLSQVSVNPFTAGNKVKVYFENELVLNGYLVSYTNTFGTQTQNRSITLELFDKVAYIENSGIGSVGKKYKQKNLISLFKQMLKDNGFDDVSVAQDFYSGSITQSLQALTANNLVLKDDAVIEKGDTVASFIDRYSNKARVLFTSNENGDILITKENTSDTDNGLVCKYNNDARNNVLGRTYTNTIVEQYSEVRIYGGASIFSGNTESSNNITAFAVDNSLLRKLKIIDYQDPIDSLTAKQLARLILQMSKAKSFIYKATVRGWRWDDKSLITPNKRIKVDDIDLQGTFHILDCTYVLSEEMGQICELTIIEKNRLTAQIEQENIYDSIKNTNTFNFL